MNPAQGTKFRKNFFIAVGLTTKLIDLIKSLLTSLKNDFFYLIMPAYGASQVIVKPHDCIHEDRKS